jgi:Thioesterase domain
MVAARAAPHSVTVQTRPLFDAEGGPTAYFVSGRSDGGGARIMARPARGPLGLVLVHPSISPVEAPPRLEDLAEACAERLGLIDPDGPYNLVAYCTGTGLAYETARLLKRRGRPVRRLVLVDAFTVAFAFVTIDEVLSIAWDGPVARYWNLPGLVRSSTLANWRVDVRNHSGSEVAAALNRLKSGLSELFDEMRGRDLLPADATDDELFAIYGSFARFMISAGRYRQRPYRGPIAHVLTSDFVRREAPLKRSSGVNHLLGGQFNRERLKAYRTPWPHDPFLFAEQGFADLLAGIMAERGDGIDAGADTLPS